MGAQDSTRAGGWSLEIAFTWVRVGVPFRLLRCHGWARIPGQKSWAEGVL